MRCEEIMKRDVQCVRQNDTVQMAAQRMRDANIGFLPVIDDDRRVLGTITDRDIAIRVVSENRTPAETDVASVMSREAVACHPGDEIGECERLMSQHHKSRILINDQDGRLCGVISLSDIAAREPLRRAAATLKEVASREARI